MPWNDVNEVVKLILCGKANCRYMGQVKYKEF